MSLEIQAFYFPFLAPKIYRETSTVKFSFKHKENAFLVSWYLVCQPLDVSAAPLKKSSSPLPSLWMWRKWEWRLLIFVTEILERHLHLLEKIATEIKIFLNCTYWKQLPCFKSPILNARWETRSCIGSYCSLLELMGLMSQSVDCPISEIQLLEKTKSMILLEV